MTAWLLDAGPLVAFFDRSDADHEWAKEQWSQAPVPMLTCEAVLAEAAYLLREHARLPSERLLALFERKVITVPFALEEHVGPVAHLLDRRDCAFGIVPSGLPPLQSVASSFRR